jgi:WD40 repeat protein
MDFSEVLPNVQTACFSPDNTLVALSNGTKIIVKSVSQLTNVQSYSFPEAITNMEFSPDSQYILVTMAKRGLVEARAIYEEEWAAKIEDPLIGILYARWSPDSRHILAFSDYQLKLSIYSLVDKTVQHIKHPKYVDKAISFTSDGKFMALAERRETKDYIGIYYTRDWKLVNYIMADSYDLNDLKWSPDNSVILAWDTPLEYKMMVYCPAQGLICKYQPYEYALGIKSVKFCESGQFLAIGSYDEKVRLFNCLTWKVVTEFEHKTSVVEYNDALIFKEEEIKDSFPYVVEGAKTSTRYVMAENTIKIPSIKAPLDKPNPPVGVSMVAWSPDNNYIASKNDNMPNVLWVWDVNSLNLKAVLIQLQPIKSFVWSENSDFLAFSTGTGRVFFWSREGASVCDIPYEGRAVTVQKIDWSQDARAMILFDKNDVVLAYPPSEFFRNPLETSTTKVNRSQYASGSGGDNDMR